MAPKEMVVYQNKLYYVYRKLRTSQIKDGYLNEIKELWRCDVVVKNRIQQDENLLFLREIEEATIVS
jgi:hypothetical protein